MFFCCTNTRRAAARNRLLAESSRDVGATEWEGGDKDYKGREEERRWGEGRDKEQRKQGLMGVGPVILAQLAPANNLTALPSTQIATTCS